MGRCGSFRLLVTMSSISNYTNRLTENNTSNSLVDIFEETSKAEKTSTEVFV